MMSAESGSTALVERNLYQHRGGNLHPPSGVPMIGSSGMR
jgi:hypothetical protein